MTTSSRSTVRPSYTEVFGLIKLSSGKLLKTLVLISLVYGALLVALFVLFSLISFVISQYAWSDLLVVRIGWGIVQVAAFSTVAAAQYAGLSTAVLKIYRNQERVSTVDNPVFKKMFALIMLVSFLNIAVAITCSGVGLALAEYTDFKERTAMLTAIFSGGACGLLTLCFLFAPFLIVDGASLSEALNGSLKLLTSNFIWLVPILTVTILTLFVFNFGFAILGATYFLLNNATRILTTEVDGELELGYDGPAALLE